MNTLYNGTSNVKGSWASDTLSILNSTVPNATFFLIDQLDGWEQTYGYSTVLGMGIKTVGHPMTQVPQNASLIETLYYSGVINEMTLSLAYSWDNSTAIRLGYDNSTLGKTNVTSDITGFTSSNYQIVG